MLSQLHDAGTFKVPSHVGQDPPHWWLFLVTTTPAISTLKVLLARHPRAEVGPTTELVLGGLVIIE